MKNKSFVGAIAVFLLISILFIGINIKKASNKEQIRKTMVNNVFTEFITISSELDYLLNNIKNKTTSYEENQQGLIMLSCNFTELHTTLKWYDTIFQEKDAVRTNYNGIAINFDNLAFTLTSTTGVVNNFSYSGILTDGKISENEVEYLSTLKNYIDIIVKAMALEDNPVQENPNITNSQINDILNKFFSKWSYRNENSPYFLLESN